MVPDLGPGLELLLLPGWNQGTRGEVRAATWVSAGDGVANSSTILRNCHAFFVSLPGLSCFQKYVAVFWPLHTLDLVLSFNVFCMQNPGRG